MEKFKKTQISLTGVPVLLLSFPPMEGNSAEGSFFANEKEFNNLFIIKGERKGKENMITPKKLFLKVTLRKGSQDLIFTAEHLVCGGWVGRDHKALQAHIDELAQLGIPGPSRIPIYMNFSTYLLTTDDEITVVSSKSSGEVEYVLLCQGEEVWVSVGSDHTDRDVETKSIPGSKQMYAKCLAPECWLLAEVKDQWDDLILRCWVFKGTEKLLYQEAPLASILGPQELLEKMPDAGKMKGKGIVLFSGTIATKSGLIYGEAYELEMEDPVLKRSIRYQYKVQVLPQYL